jgi:Flp pilus assembly protein TadD
MMSAERIRELRELLEDEPDDALLRLTLGTELLDAGDAAAALPHLERAVAVAPRYTAAYRHLGTALERLGRGAEARAAWERGIAVAEDTGDLQAGKEMRVLLSRLREPAG